MSKFEHLDEVHIIRLYCDDPMSASRRDCLYGVCLDCCQQGLDEVMLSHEFLSTHVRDHVEVDALGLLDVDWKHDHEP